MLEEREREGNMKWKRRVEEKYKEGGREGRGGEWDREEGRDAVPERKSGREG